MDSPDLDVELEWICLHLVDSLDFVVDADYVTHGLDVEGLDFMQHHEEDLLAPKVSTRTA